MGSKKPPLAVIAGPTASGKSALALELAEREKGVLINADASQVYADLQIISARPPAEEEARAPHRLFGTIAGSVACTTAHWADLARQEIQAAHADGRLPILVGGTGMYLRTLLDGIAPVPVIDADVREAVRALEAGQVRQALEQEDPDMAARLHANDAQRNARALEVIRSTGQSLAVWQAAPLEGGLADQVDLRAQVLDWPRDALVARIDARVDIMWEQGAVAEAEALMAKGYDPDLPVMRAIGVPPLLAYLRGEMNKADAIQRWKFDTRQYAKRQSTWWRNQTGGWDRIRF